MHTYLCTYVVVVVTATRQNIHTNERDTYIHTYAVYYVHADLPNISTVCT